MSVTSTLTTANDLLQMADDGYRYELIKGELLRMPPTGGEHGVTAMNIGGPLHQHIKKNGLGLVFGAETGFLLARDPTQFSHRMWPSFTATASRKAK
jgi:Uma2 family endonuclease